MHLKIADLRKVWGTAILIIVIACSLVQCEQDRLNAFSNWMRQFNCTTGSTKIKLPINNGISAIHLVNCSVPEIHENMFSTFGSIQTLNIRNSHLEAMDAKALNGLRQLESLAITFNHLIALRQWSAHYFNAMQSIDFQSNAIAELATDALDHYPNVQTINLSNNHIVSIPHTFFGNNSRLSAIDLGRNRLAQVSTDDFYGLRHLAELSLSQNQIRVINQAVFRTNGELQMLRLDCNRLERLDADVFRFVTRLVSLNLSTNALETIEPNTFDQIVDLQHLDLSANRIQELRTDWAKGLQKLETLNLSNNQFTRLQFLESLFNIKSLGLSSNNLQTIPVATFANLKSLENLQLDANQLVTLDDQLFSHQHLLRSIDVSNNHLSTATFLHPLSNLRYLGMAHNHFETINLTLFFHYHEVELSGNPWSCTWLIEEITDVADGIHFGRNYSIDGRERHHGELMVPGIDCVDETGQRKGIVLLQMPSHDRNAYSGDILEKSTESAVAKQNKTIRKMLNDEFDYKACLIWVAIAVIGVFGVAHVGKILFQRSELNSEKFRLSQQSSLLPSIETTLSIPSSSKTPSRSPQSPKPSPSFMVRVDGSQQSYSRCDDGSN